MNRGQFLVLTIAWVVFGQTLEEILTSQDDLVALNSWLTSSLSSSLVVFDILSSATGVTLLAPSNNALAQLSNTSLYGQLTSDPNLLVAFLSYHVLNGVHPISALSAAPVSTVLTYMNMREYSNVSGGQVIDSVPQIGGGLTFVTGNGAQSNVQQYDLNYTGGTLHIIDSVLSIPGTVTDTLISGGLTAAAGALRRADIDTPLNMASDVTVFAPSNDAFNAIGSTVNGMTLEQLTNVLNYHVIPGKVLYSQLMTPGSEATQEGGSLNFRTERGELFVNGAKVIAADVLVGNGVVHVVDGVLNPDNSTATPDPLAATQAPAFNGASSTSGGVPFTSAVVTTTTSAAPAGPSTSPSNSPADDASAGSAAVGFAMLFVGAAMWANL